MTSAERTVSGCLEGKVSGYFEGTRRDVFDMDMVWIDTSDDAPSGFFACQLEGYDVSIVGRVAADGSVSRRVRLGVMFEDDLPAPDVVFDEEGYGAAQLDAAAARRLGQALVDAADEIDRS